MYPRVLIDLDKIEENTRIIATNCKKSQVDIMGVTKVFCAVPEIAEAEIRGGVKYLADSRIENLKKVKGLGAERVLLRLPMLSQVDDVVNHSDISLNSELETIEALNLAAIGLKKTHKIILMIDLGDLREGILPVDVDVTVEAITKLSNIKLHGIGVNLTCYGGVIPTEENLGQLLSLAKHIEEHFKLNLEIISGGNSSSYYLVPDNKLPQGINNLRMGEILVLGRETAYGKLIAGMHDDCFLLEAEIIELKTKDSLPKGEIGMNAFGEKPTFEDKGMRKRAILGVGVQDVRPDQLIALDDKVEQIGASSDHMIIDVTESETDYKVGDTLKFKLEYGAILSLFTSEYIDKTFL